MIYIDRNNIPVPGFFDSREIQIANERLHIFYLRPEALRSQERFVRPFDPELRREIIHSLRLLFKNKCAYCESPPSLARVSSAGLGWRASYFQTHAGEGQIELINQYI